LNFLLLPGGAHQADEVFNGVQFIHPARHYYSDLKYLNFNNRFKNYDLLQDNRKTSIYLFFFNCCCKNRCSSHFTHRSFEISLSKFLFSFYLNHDHLHILHIHIYIYIYIYKFNTYVCTYVYMYVHMYVCIVVEYTYMY